MNAAADGRLAKAKIFGRILACVSRNTQALIEIINGIPLMHNLRSQMVLSK